MFRRQEFVHKIHANFELVLAGCLKNVCGGQLEEIDSLRFPLLFPTNTHHCINLPTNYRTILFHLSLTAALLENSHNS